MAIGGTKRCTHNTHTDKGADPTFARRCHTGVRPSSRSNREVGLCQQASKKLTRLRMGRIAEPLETSVIWSTSGRWKGSRNPKSIVPLLEDLALNFLRKHKLQKQQLLLPIRCLLSTSLFFLCLVFDPSASSQLQKPVATQPDAAAGRGGAKPPKKAVIKSKKEKITKEEKIIVISPDKNEESKQASCSRSSRKKITALTSVLTARSKAACGLLTDKPKDLMIDIDAADTEDQLAVVDYVEDIYTFYKSAEQSSRPHDYMGAQVEINAKMRAILADWLIEVHHKFELTPETLYLTFHIIDRYLSMETVLRIELQLVGVSAMLIASKYEEIWAPEVNDFICISDRAYTREQILGMEKAILDRLEWNLTVPTPYVFLVRFLKAAASCHRDEEMERMVFFFAELALVEYSMALHSPSMVAAASVYAARCTLKKTPLWTETLKRHTGFTERQLLDCTQTLVNSHAVAPEGKLKVVYKKYCGEQFGAVALQQPATELVKEMMKAGK